MESEVQKDEGLTIEQYAKAKGELEKTWRGRGIDWFLQDLARWANDMSLTFGITLHTPAGIVSGTVISHETYFKEFANQFAGPWAGESEDLVRKMITSLGEPIPANDKPDSNFQFIHLKEAQFYAPGQNPMPAKGVLWRGKISSVSSFNLGCFSPA
ncbi:gas vesicle accessory protein GvpU [Pseudomonas sp. DG56-2]|uniref:gas vesicle accessory protein GvpU n=1 Tax=Pseudomonas sp. DG56-2 TaxID=2320270 RepID=UPI0010A60763|nr:gas vesicle accessory protein GvpU [Pseudomonas sp. DG56-2]